MAVVINEFEVIPAPETDAAPAPAPAGGGGESEPDIRALQTWIEREAWRLERLAAD